MLQESIKGYTRWLVTCVSFIIEVSYLLRGTNNSALEIFGTLLPGFLGSKPISGLWLRLELISLSTWCT